MPSLFFINRIDSSTEKENSYMDGFNAVLQPIESAQGLPNSCYTDPAMFEEETKRLFAADWAAIGFGLMFRPGCVYPISFGIPLSWCATVQVK